MALALTNHGVARVGGRITGNPDNWNTAGGHLCRSLDATLSALPATTQERCFSRMYLLLPLAIAVLSVFWIASGLVGFLYHDTAQSILTSRGFSPVLASGAVLMGSAIDVLLGSAVLVRQWTRCAAFGMIAVSIGYLTASAIWTPYLWADPLGPMVKVIPGIMLAAIISATLETR